MSADKIQELITQIKIVSLAYVRNLSVAEDAVQKGQFNIAKVLRAAAHTQRILAMGAARLVAGKTDKSYLLYTESFNKLPGLLPAFSFARLLSFSAAIRFAVAVKNQPTKLDRSLDKPSS